MASWWLESLRPCVTNLNELRLPKRTGSERRQGLDYSKSWFRIEAVGEGVKAWFNRFQLTECEIGKTGNKFNTFVNILLFGLKMFSDMILVQTRLCSRVLNSTFVFYKRVQGTKQKCPPPWVNLPAARQPAK